MNDRIEKLLEHVRVNEQIERLAKESGCTIDRLGFGEGNLEKFAELLIRECAMIVEGFTIEQEVALDDYQEYEASAVLKEHFGVKE